MKYINVFDDQASFDAVKANLPKPQLSLVKPDTIYCLSDGQQPSQDEPAANEIWYTTDNGRTYDVSTVMDTINGLMSGTTPITVTSNTYSDGKGKVSFSGNVEYVGLDTENRKVYPMMMPTYGGGTVIIGDASLTELWLPDSVTIIYNNAFAGCEGLKKVHFSSAVTTINPNTFSDCFGITDIHFDGTQAQWEAIDKGYGWNIGCPAFTVRCTDGNVTIPAWSN